MEYIDDFLAKERQKEFVVTKNLSNGVRFIRESETKPKYLHEWFKPLDDEQIDKLQADVNKAQRSAYVFPEWYRDFFKSTNGLNLFFASISFFGEQTPLVEHPKYGLIEAGIGGYSDDPVERENWMAPYNLRYTNSGMLDPAIKKRWLVIGSYGQDGTLIVLDFKTNKIVAMYVLPVTLSIKEFRKMKEADFEQRIFAEWKDFETLFMSETERLSKIFAGFMDTKEFSLLGLDYIQLPIWKKTLPKGHKDFVG